MYARVGFAMAALLLVTGCSGGSNALAPISAPATGGSTQSDTAIAVTNSFGTSINTLSSYDATVDPPGAGPGGGPEVASRAHLASSTSGSCLGRVEFFAPDRNGDANSTELEDFKDYGCSNVVRDSVRIYTSTGANSETVKRTVSLYVYVGPKIGTRTEMETISNASFDSYGYPIATTGFERSDTGRPESGDYFNISSGNELVMLPGTASNQYCGDSAGFSLGKLLPFPQPIGWQGVDSNGSRTVNGDGSVTFGSTHVGTVSLAAWPAYTLSIATGKQSTGCPITTPMFTLAGAQQLVTYDIPVSVTFQDGMMVDFSIPDATFPDGYTLTVSTPPGASPTSSSFIQGTIAKGTEQVATFSLDCFGDGTLTVPGVGVTWTIEDWLVRRKSPFPIG